MLTKIISGGQTGADRGGLDAAISAGIAHGGTCSLGRRAEDGRVPERYVLVESASSAYGPRTMANVLDAQGSVIFHPPSGITPGSRATKDYCEEAGRPCLVICIGEITPLIDPYTVFDLTAFVFKHGIETLNVAGSRGSKARWMQRRVDEVMRAVLVRVRVWADAARVVRPGIEWLLSDAPQPAGALVSPHGLVCRDRVLGGFMAGAIARSSERGPDGRQLAQLLFQRERDFQERWEAEEVERFAAVLTEIKAPAWFGPDYVGVALNRPAGAGPSVLADAYAEGCPTHRSVFCESAYGCRWFADGTQKAQRPIGWV